MLKLVLQGKEYPFPDFESITFEEGSAIKKATGLRMGELAEAFAAGDTDAIFALFLVAKGRNDGAYDIDALRKLKVSDLEVVDEPEPAPLEADKAGPSVKSAQTKK